MIKKLYLDPLNRVGQSVENLKITKLKDYSTIQSLNHNFSFIQMNSTFIELINRKYLWKGKLISILLLCILPLFLILVLFGIVMIFNRPSNDIVVVIGLSYIFLFAISLQLLIVFFLACVRLEYIRPLYEPIIFNRINKKIFVWDSKKEFYELELNEVYFEIKKINGSCGTELFELHCYEVLNNIIITDTQIGAPCYDDSVIYGFLSYIKLYLDEGPEKFIFDECIDDPTNNAMNRMTYCYDIVGKKESLKQSWQSIFVPYHHNGFQKTLFCIFELIRFIMRRLFIIPFNKIPKWSEKVLEANKVEVNDPYVITHKDNLKFGLFKVKK